MRFSDIIEDVNFRAICVPIRVALHAPNWRKRHSNVNVWGLYNTLEHATEKYAQQMEAYVPALTKLLNAIGKASPQLIISTETFAGYLRLIDDYGAVVPPMMLAYASAPDRFATPVQVADATHSSESLWRNRAAAGEIPGAIKAGKQWLLPRDVLRVLYRIELPRDAFTPTPAEQEERAAQEIEREQGANAPDAPDAPTSAVQVADDAPLTDEEWEIARRQLARFERTNVEEN